MQHGKVIDYASRQLKIYDMNYPTHELQLADVVFIAKIWRHYLYEIHVDVYNDHKTLEYVFTKKDLKSPAKVMVNVVERLRHECSLSPWQG